MNSAHMRFLRELLKEELGHNSNGWEQVQAAWDLPSQGNYWLTFQEAAWQYHVDLFRNQSPKKIRITPVMREASLKRVGDTANKLLELLKDMDRVSRRYCISLEDEDDFLSHLKALTENAYKGEKEVALDKSRPNGLRPAAGKRDLPLEGLFLEVGTILLSRNGTVDLLKNTARIIHWWAGGRHAAVDGVECWVSDKETLPEFGGAPLKRVRKKLDRRLARLSGNQEDR